ncbi:MBL fold metallo-hydrolase [Paenibacillus campi]|uniref:MBL fold metallo-hydrolase n=1 Tax=Paenibacillus campi TaxID=3106031 RepID=UPI002B001F58|nr:MBL fold metallo-hydrolase [Paenibacillus sp. SGZ-1014]
MNITQQIEVLELKLEAGGNPIVLHPFVIYEQGQAILFDTGFPGSYEALQALIHPSYPVRSVVLTHQDIDHIGSLPQFMAQEPQLAVYAHEHDRAAIDGTAPFVKGSPERLNMLLSSVSQEDADEFRRVFSAATPANVNHVVHDGEVLPFAGGMQVIHTPGHTPGHISLYHINSKTLFAGDAMNVVDGELVGPIPQFTPNFEQAIQSLNKLRTLAVDKVICYHGGIFTGDFQQRLDELVSRS